MGYLILELRNENYSLSYFYCREVCNLTSPSMPNTLEPMDKNNLDWEILIQKGILYSDLKYALIKMKELKPSVL